MALSTTQYGYIVDPMVPFTDASGTAIKNGYIRVFLTGTSTPVLTYANYDGATNSETIELDSAGRCVNGVIGSKGLTYKVCVYDAESSQENPILTIDKIAPFGATITAGTGATVVTGLDSVTTKANGWIKATVAGTSVNVEMDATNVTNSMSTAADVEQNKSDYSVPAMSNDNSNPDVKIPLSYFADIQSGLDETIENIAPAFDPATYYVKDDEVSYQGKIYVFDAPHCGAWDLSNVHEKKTNPSKEYDNVETTVAVAATSLFTRTRDIDLNGYRIARYSDTIASSSTYRVRGFSAKRGDIFFMHSNLQKMDECIDIGFTSANSISENDAVKVIYRHQSPNTDAFDSPYIIAPADGYFLVSHRSTLWSSTEVQTGELCNNLSKVMSRGEQIVKDSYDVGGASFIVGGNNDVENTSVSSGFVKPSLQIGDSVSYVDTSSTYLSYGVYDITGLSDVVVATKTYHNSNGYYIFVVDTDGKIIDRYGYSSGVDANITEYVHLEDGAKYLYVNCYSSTTSYNTKVDVTEGEVVDLRQAMGTAAESIDDEWLMYIEDKVSSIHDYELNLSRNTSRVMFFTDTHWFYKNGSEKLSNYGKTLDIIDRIVKKVGCDIVVFGGDAVYAAANAEYTKKATFFIQNNYNRVPRVPMLGVQGNHDFKSVGGADGTILYDQGATKNILLSDCINEVVTPNIDACYYYYDDKNSKIRHIVWASTTAGVNGIDDAQAKWIAENAVLSAPNDYNFVFFCHYNIGSNAIAGSANNSICGILMDVAEAVNARSTITIDGTQYDFSSVNGKILCYISGHHHADTQTFYRGVLCINTASDAPLSDNAELSMYFDHAIPRGYTLRKDWENEGNDIGVNTQIIDYMTIDAINGIVNCERIGAYYNRRFHINYINVNVGDTITVAPSLSGTLTYHCFDNTAEQTGYQVESDKTVTSIWSGLDSSSIVSSNGDGTWAANSAGEAVIMVMDGNQNKEFWGVKVS